MKSNKLISLISPLLLTTLIVDNTLASTIKGDELEEHAVQQNQQHVIQEDPLNIEYISEKESFYKRANERLDLSPSSQDALNIWRELYLKTIGYVIKGSTIAKKELPIVETNLANSLTLSRETIVSEERIKVCREIKELFDQYKEYGSHITPHVYGAILVELAKALFTTVKQGITPDHVVELKFRESIECYKKVLSNSELSKLKHDFVKYISEEKAFLEAALGSLYYTKVFPSSSHRTEILTEHDVRLLEASYKLFKSAAEVDLQFKTRFDTVAATLSKIRYFQSTDHDKNNKSETTQFTTTSPLEDSATTSTHQIAESKYQLALDYRDGKVEGFPKESAQSLDKALELFIELSEHGNEKAMHNRANIHYVRGDYVEAYKWFKKAADKGLKPSRNNLEKMVNDKKVYPFIKSIHAQEGGNK